jgi:hypothetical protein
MSAIHLPELVLFCSGCKRPFEAPRSAGNLDVECRWCGKAMHVVTIGQAGEKGAAREDPRLDHTRHGGHGVRTPEAEVAVKHEYKAAFGVLNKRGVPAGR